MLSEGGGGAALVETPKKKKIGNEEDGRAVGIRLRLNEAHIISKTTHSREKTHPGGSQLHTSSTTTSTPIPLASPFTLSSTA